MAPEVNQHLLIAVDVSENSRRSLQYVAGMLGGKGLAVLCQLF
jgi:hypothetical protein